MTRAGHHASRSGSDHQVTRLRTRCPHCNAWARIRTSYVITALYTELRFECQNDACGHIWLASLEVLRTLCPSDTPNPEIQIPLRAQPAPSESAMAEPAAMRAAG